MRGSKASSPSRPAAVQAVADVIGPALELVSPGLFASRIVRIHARHGAEARDRIETTLAAWIAWPMFVSDADRARAAVLAGRVLAALDEPATDGDLGEHAAHDGGEQFGAGRHGEQHGRAVGARKGQP